MAVFFRVFFIASPASSTSNRFQSVIYKFKIDKPTWEIDKSTITDNWRRRLSAGG